MRKVFSLSLFLMFILAAYFFVIDSKDKIKLKKTVEHIEKIPSEPFEDIKTQIAPKQELTSNTEKDKKQIFECDIDLIKSGYVEKFAEPNAIQYAFRSNKNHTTQLAYALSANMNLNESNDANQVQLLAKLLKQENDNKLTSYILASKCSDILFQDFCDENLMKQIIENDPNNGALWFQIATIEAEKNNLSGVASALEQVIIATYFNDYYGETIEIFDNALELIGMTQQYPRMISSFGLGAALTLSPVQNLFKLCKDNAVNRADIAQLCLDAGKRLATESKTQMNQFFGLGIQTTVFSELNDQQNVDAIKSQKEALLRIIETSSEAQSLMLSDPELLIYWFTQLKLFGEVEASRLVTEEAERLLSDPDYNPCSL